MSLVVFVEKWVVRRTEFLHCLLVNHVSLELLSFLLRDVSGTEGLVEVHKEDNVEDEHHCQNGNSKVEVFHGSKEVGPDGLSNQCTEEHECNEWKKSSNCKLRTSSLHPCLRLLAFTEDDNQTEDGSNHQEWEVEDSKIVDGDHYAGFAFISNSVVRWALRDWDTKMDDEARHRFKTEIKSVNVTDLALSKLTWHTFQILVISWVDDVSIFAPWFTNVTIEVNQTLVTITRSAYICGSKACETR